VRPKLTRNVKRGNKLTPHEREAVYQTYLALGKSPTRAAKSLGISRPTVYKIVREIEDTRSEVELAKTEELVHASLTNRFHGLASEIIDSINPADLQSGRIETKDKDGNLIAVKEYGPSLMVKVTAAAIATDKIKVLQDYKARISAGGNNNQLLIPSTVDGLLDAIRNKVTSLQFLNVNLRHENPELATRVDNAMVQVAEQESEPVHATDERLDFRNPE
jgi:transposase-like protein